MFAVSHIGLFTSVAVVNQLFKWTRVDSMNLHLFIPAFVHIAVEHGGKIVGGSGENDSMGGDPAALADERNVGEFPRSVVILQVK